MADLLRAYLVVGTDELKRDRTVARLKAHLDPGLADFNLDELTASADMQGPELVASAQTMPFGPGFRLVIVHDADKLPKAAIESLVNYLDDPNPASVLCLVAEKLDKRETKYKELYRAVEKQGKNSVVDCSTPKIKELPSYVQVMAKRRGLSIALPAATELVNLIGDNTTLLDNQIATLQSLLGGRTRIEVNDVRSHVSRIAEVKFWELQDALSDRDVSRALRLYHKMISPDLLFLQNRICERVRELIHTRSLIERGEAAELPKALGKQPWLANKYASQARRFRDGELEQILSAGIACERALKGSEDDETAFVRYIMAFRR